MSIIVSSGRVTVRAPVGTDIVQVEQLLTAKKNWIIRHLQRQLAQPAVISWQQRGEILFKGQPLPVSFGRAAKSEVQLVTCGLNINVSHRVSAAKLADWHVSLLSRWLQAQATAELTRRAEHWAQVMQLRYQQIVFGQWQRRWGYCDSRGRIGLNWRLIMAPQWVCDYVLVHELAHLQQMNHSALFWRVVSRHLPDYQQAQAWLRYYQEQLTV